MIEMLAALMTFSLVGVGVYPILIVFYTRHLSPRSLRLGFVFISYGIFMLIYSLAGWIFYLIGTTPISLEALFIVNPRDNLIPAYSYLMASWRWIFTGTSLTSLLVGGSFRYFFNKSSRPNAKNHLGFYRDKKGKIVYF